MLAQILLENSGPTFRSSDKFVGAVKQYLCLSLLKNVTSTAGNVFQLCCSIFMTLVLKFRDKLKAEIGVFFPMIVLRALESPASATHAHKSTVLRFIYKMCEDPQVSPGPRRLRPFSVSPTAISLHPSSL